MTLKIFGGFFILMGTTIGAGMLALPLVSSSSGFLASELILVAIWALMTITGLLVLEVTLALKRCHNNFHSMAKAALGDYGQIITWITVMFLLYALASAYISGASSLMENLLSKYDIHIAIWVNMLVFTIVFGGVVFFGTDKVDYLIRGLMSIKGVVLIIVMFCLMPHVNIHQLEVAPHQMNFVLALAPIFLTSFGFHTVIPSLVNYLGPNVRILRRIIIWGATLPMIIYTFWLIGVLGILPYHGPHSFEHLSKLHNSVGMMITYMDEITQSNLIAYGMNIFSNVAVVTSFLGVTLGLFDFISDGFQFGCTKKGRLYASLITFVPPFLISIFFQKGFLFALAFAGLCVTILEVVLPALMAYKLRRSDCYESRYRFSCNYFFLFFIVGLGILLLGVQVLSFFGFFKGI